MRGGLAVMQGRLFLCLPEKSQELKEIITERNYQKYFRNL